MSQAAVMADWQSWASGCVQVFGRRQQRNAPLGQGASVPDVIRFATVNGAQGLRLDSKVGSLAPGKEADIVLLDANALNVTPLNNVPGAVVTLMDRSNVDTVIVAGTIRKWKGSLARRQSRKAEGRSRSLAGLSVRQDRGGARPVPRLTAPEAENNS